MKTLLKSVKIVDPLSKHNGKVRDILINNGKIADIKASIKEEKNYQVVKVKNAHVSPGWFDSFANFRDPGFEFKEDLESGLEAAAKGGFTGVLISPDTQPPIDSKSSLEYIFKRAEGNVVKIEVCGALSEKLEGNQLAEMLDMSASGAKAFGDGKMPVDRSELMNRALEYSKNFDGVIMSFPHDSGLAPGGVMHEGKSSVSLGLKGIPSTSEELRVVRDIEILRYTGGKLHIPTISSARSLELIKKARKEGLNITCGIAAHQLSFTDEDLGTFDTRLKVLPPFRSSSDKKALLKGLADGHIDVICSDHSPEDVENKKREFENAAFGISSIETAFASIRKETNSKIELDRLIELLAINPRHVLGIEAPTIEQDSEANLTLFDPDAEFHLDRSEMASKSDNNPFGHATLTGQVIGVIRGKEESWN